MDKYKFGEFIYTQRKNKGLTQDELGRKLKVTNKAVSKWETGETLPDIQLLPELASVLGVTIDELLTQTKPEVEKVYVDPKKNTRLFLWVTCGILLILTISFALLCLNINQSEDIIIDKSNAEEYFDITPCQNIINDGYGVDIKGSIIKNEKVLDATLVLNFTIQYYYVNTDNKISEILYLDRYVSYDSLTNDFSIILRPKSQIENFKSFYEVKISYEIVEASGKVIE